MVPPNFSGDAPRQSAHSQKLKITARGAMILVHELTAHTVGGGDTIMKTVSRGDEVVVEAKVPPQDIDQVVSAAEAVVRITTGNQRTTPVITGNVTRVSADITRKQQQNSAHPVQAYYSVRVAQVARLNDIRLIRGMPAEVFIRMHELRSSICSSLFKSR
jgi:HlyD family secretion protein